MKQAEPSQSSRVSAWADAESRTTLLPSIFEYEQFSRFLRDYMRARQKLDRRVSYRWVARRLGLSSHSPVSMIACGKRRPTEAFASRLLSVLGLTYGEIKYGMLLIKVETYKADLQAKLS